MFLPTWGDAAPGYLAPGMRRRVRRPVGTGPGFVRERRYRAMKARDLMTPSPRAVTGDTPIAEA
ncbi:MAG TPA: hypothetical protein VF263_03630, partial [Longimicrobiaceae bacterium]